MNEQLPPQEPPTMYSLRLTGEYLFQLIYGDKVTVFPFADIYRIGFDLRADGLPNHVGWASIRTPHGSVSLFCLDSRSAAQLASAWDTWMATGSALPSPAFDFDETLGTGNTTEGVIRQTLGENEF